MKADITYYDCVTSTNALLLAEAAEGAEPGRTLVAWKQMQGRGRLGRLFESPEGGIYMSMLTETDSSMLLTAKAAVAVKRAVEQETGRKVRIKWVNDILCNGKKVAGILAQGAGKLTVTGVGINFTTAPEAFSPQVRDSVISLYGPGEKTRDDAVRIAELIAENMYTLAESQDDSSWFDEYRAGSAVLGHRVDVFQGGVKTGSGTAVLIDEKCALHVIDERKGEMILSTGEVTLRLKDD